MTDPVTYPFLYFVAMWFGVTGLLAYAGGWARLANAFPAEMPVPGDRFRFVSGSMGLRFVPVSYGNCLFVTVSPSGLRISIFFPFRFLSPPLFVPWSAMESVTQGRYFLLMRSTVLVIKEQWPRISLRDAAGDAAYRAFLASRSGEHPDTEAAILARSNRSPFG
jgi:hypothetical protein